MELKPNDTMTINGEVWVRFASIEPIPLPPPPPPLDERLTEKEVAKMLDCTTRTVEKYGKEGLIRRIGGKGTGVATRYSRNSVLAFLNGKREVA